MCQNAVTQKIYEKNACIKHECNNAPMQVIYDKEICINSKNLFGTQISMLNDRTAISCAFRELIEAKWGHNENDTHQWFNEIPLKGKRGSCYTFSLKTGRISNYFDFDYSDVRPVASGHSNWDKTGGIGPMGPNFLSLKNRFVFSTPFARFGKGFGFDWATARMQGSFVSYDISQDRYRLAEGVWSKDYHSSPNDPHTHDYTGNPIVRGNFFKTRKEHFAIGSPNAKKEFGRVYICYDCFMKDGHRSSSDDLIIEGSDALCEGNNIGRCFHDGSRFGHAIAAVDIDGDTFDELIIGAPLYSTKVKTKTHLPE